MIKRYFVVFTNGFESELKDEEVYEDVKSWLKTEDSSTFSISGIQGLPDAIDIVVLHRKFVDSCRIEERKETWEQEEKRKKEIKEFKENKEMN